MARGMSDGLGDALSRFNASSGPGTVDDDTAGSDTGPGKKSVTGHVHAIHSHKDGSHHLMIHHGGQLIHHSEHPSFEEAHAAMAEHAGMTQHAGKPE